MGFLFSRLGTVSFEELGVFNVFVDVVVVVVLVVVVVVVVVVIGAVCRQRHST